MQKIEIMGKHRLSRDEMMKVFGGKQSNVLPACNAGRCVTAVDCRSIHSPELLCICVSNTCQQI
jgi:hypothetical protein